METIDMSSQNDYWAVISFVLYLSGIVGIGIYASRFSSRGISEYFIGGRTINRYVVALSAVVSGRSAWLLLGLTGMAYSMGAQAVWAAVGYILVEVFLFLYYARRLRRYSGVRDCITVPDFFGERFKEHASIIRMVLVFIILIFMVGYISAQFVAGGKTFAAGFGLQAETGMWITATIVLLYTMIGGFLAVSLTDMVQAFLMLISLFLLPALVIFDAGGWVAITDELSSINPSLIDPYALTIGAAIGSLGIGLGSPGNPHIISRYLSIEDEKQLKVACLAGTFWNIIMAWGALFTGLAGRVIFPELSMLPGEDTENLFPFLAQSYLPPFLFGLVVASIFAAIMSSADSQLLVAASSVVRDFYQKIIARDKQLSNRLLVRSSRMVVLVLVVISLITGFFAEDLVYWLVLFAWAGLGAALGPTSILALYWKKTTGPGVLAGMLSGALVTIIWRLTPCLREISYELIPGFTAGLLATIIVSLFSSPPASVEKDFKIFAGS
ncbi:MAG: sodium/proline symporter [Saprospirales bacterium]|nr:MAG: sodium/proline symporter [Saprospirales bacterium]